MVFVLCDRDLTGFSGFTSPLSLPLSRRCKLGDGVYCVFFTSVHSRLVVEECTRADV